MEVDAKKVNTREFLCPACGTSLDYRQLIDSENIVLRRYKAIIQDLKLEYGEVFLDKNKVLLGHIKELENLYSILIKDS